VVDVSGYGGHQQPQEQHKEKWYEDCVPDCTPDCPDCDCAPDCGLFTLAWLAVLTPARPPRRRATVPGRAGMAAIRGYQKWLSPRLRTRCRHTPTCSAYGMEAVRRYGLVTGVRLIAGRLDRCKAPTPHGTVDPVP
jgi:putative membrane protein insertion efficiency factor